MPKRRGGKNSEQARRGTAEPDAEHSGSEDEPLGEPPLPTPYTRLLDAEAQTAPGSGSPKVGTIRILEFPISGNPLSPLDAGP